jgi:hypothetical protein
MNSVSQTGFVAGVAGRLALIATIAIRITSISG